MDSFKSGDEHQYGAYVFVQWLLGTSGKPGSAGWKFLKEPIQDAASSDPTAGVNAAVTAYKGDSLGQEVGQVLGRRNGFEP